MKMHCQSCKTHFYNNTLDVEENIAERVRWLGIAAIQQQEALCVLQMQEMEWICLDEIEYNNIKDVSAVNDPEVRTPLFDPITENVDDACDI